MSDKDKGSSELRAGAKGSPGAKIRVRQPPARSARGREEAAERERRLAAALRANLSKRKAQLMARGSDSSDSLSPAPPPRAKRN